MSISLFIFARLSYCLHVVSYAVNRMIIHDVQGIGLLYWIVLPTGSLV